jgi:dipeptidyl-peptidase-4
MKKILGLLLLFSNVLSAQETDITLYNILRGRFRQESVYGISPMKNGESYTTLDYGKIVKYSYKTGLSEDTIAQLNVFTEDYEFSSDGKKILYYINSEYIYRRSFTAKYSVYDTETKKTIKIGGDFGAVQLATFSPDGKKVAFVYENNIFIQELETGKTEQITADGKKNFILNGLPDWVYEEEFEFNKAFEFSADGRYLAYIKFDETDVKSYTLQYYPPMPDDYNPSANYPENYVYKYPKAGEDNSKVSVHVYDFLTGKTLSADLGSETDIYIPRICWMAETGNLAVMRMNRLQNKLDIMKFDPAAQTTQTFFTLTDKYYIEESVMPSVKFLSGGKSFLITSDKDRYRQIYHYSAADGKLIAKVTDGDKEVIDFCGVDEKNKKVYYTAVGEKSWQTEVYVSDLNGKKRMKLSEKAGQNDPEFSSDFRYFINFYSSASTPYYITVNDNKGKELRVVKDNSALKKQFEDSKCPKKEFFSWKNSSGDMLDAFVIKPYNFDPAKKYPVLVVGYNGPDYNLVNDRYEFQWYNALVEDGILVACTDTRGTGRKGTQFRKCTYGQLGKFETEDLVSFSKFLKGQSYVDGERLGIWGWSYGGFMSSNVMTRGAGSYKIGIAVAPVTNWEYYDNIYTERYMGLPQNNHKGYTENSPLSYAKNLEGKFLLIFGSCDDNVHPQNSMNFCEALVQADKEFEFMQYTNKNHGIYGGNTTWHLYKKMVKFIKENL